MFFWGVSKLSFKHNSFRLDITLQTNAFNASNEIVCESVLLTSEYDIMLQMNTFTASNEIVSATHLQIRYRTADEHVYR